MQASGEKIVMECSICKHSELTKVLSLGHQPPSDAFLKREDLEKPEITYPLDLYFCPACSLVQLGYAVSPDILFREYAYNTGTNNSLRANFKALALKIIQEYKLKEGDFVIDVGSNDGTLLENYIPHGIKVLGIDPSSSTSLAIERGIPTLVDFFNADSAQKVLAEHGPAQVITATNVFAHVSELDSFMQGIVQLLDTSGIFISENGYIVDMVEGMQYDSIYHEHLRYYSVASLTALFKKYGMEIVDVEHIESHGGSIRVYAAKRAVFPVQNRVLDMVAAEKKKGFSEATVYQTFAQNVIGARFSLLDIIFSLKKQNMRIAGIGAPAKGNTLLNYCKLDCEYIEYLAEKSTLKIGLFSPGMHIPVVPESQLIEDRPEAALLLSWNLVEELMPKLRQMGFSGKFIIPNPAPRIVN